MGYVHYFTQHETPTAEQWEAITDDFKKLVALPDQPPIAYESDIDSPPYISPDFIRFNGIGKDGHDTMLLMRDEPGFSFCKTARKPYDIFVVALLVLAHHHTGCWEIGSDGTLDDWADGLALARRVQPTASMPPGV